MGASAAADPSKTGKGFRDWRNVNRRWGVDGLCQSMQFHDLSASLFLARSLLRDRLGNFRHLTWGRLTRRSVETAQPEDDFDPSDIPSSELGHRQYRFGHYWARFSE
jgi:hypothetical protein